MTLTTVGYGDITPTNDAERLFALLSLLIGAVVFGSGFHHSTEPGCGVDGEVHGYLCFTFGTDEEEAWPEIGKTLDTQSRVVVHPNGELMLSQLGEGIEAAMREYQQRESK